MDSYFSARHSRTSKILPTSGNFQPLPTNSLWNQILLRSLFSSTKRPLVTQARKDIVADSEGYYHCIARCVRRAFLYGYDKVTGKSFDHRKEWIRNRLKFLVTVFTIEALACGLMDNHQHLLLRTRPDLLEKLSDEEIIRRWLMLYPAPFGRDLTKEELQAMAQNTVRVTELRARLGSLSWFMKSLNEYLARRSNKEDCCKGRFWEGRFKSQKVEGESALLSCAVYIDLNPIRAGKADRPEDSKYTSAYERIHALKKAADKTKEPDLWLCPIQDTETRRGFLSISLPQYLELLDTTGRILKEGKKGKIPDHLAPVLTRLGIEPKNWLDTTCTIGRGFSSLVSDSQTIVERASSLGKKWLKGISVARLAFA